MKALGLFFTFLVPFIFAPGAAATTWFLEADGTGDAPHIQAAIDSSSPGDTILLNDGTFAGVGNQIFIVDHTLVFRSVNGPLATRINLNLTPGFTINADDCRIEGIAIDKARSAFGGAIAVNGGNFTAEECWFTDCGATAGGGILFNNTASGPGRVIDCNFEVCEAGNFSGSAIWAFFGISELVMEGCGFWKCEGLAVVVGGDVTSRNCTFVENTALNLDPFAIGVIAGHATVENTIFAHNDGGVGAVTAPTIDISCTDQFGNTNGGDSRDWTGDTAPFANINDNFSEDPLFCDMIFEDYDLAANSPCAPGNHPDAAPCGLIGAFPVGCGGTSATEAASWTDVKEMFR